MGVLPTETTYGTLINGLCKLGNMDETGKLVTEMVKGDLRPNQVYLQYYY